MNNFYKIYILLFVLFIPIPTIAQQIIAGTIYMASDKTPIKGAAIKIKNSNQATTTDASGKFSLNLSGGTKSILISYKDYIDQELTISFPYKSIIIYLEKSVTELEEVLVSTGYYQLPKERVTGSFTHIDNKLINRSINSNILGRLEGIASSLHFDKRGVTGEADQSLSLRIRGLSTILSDQSPLIVVDNFPYEGKIESINPNDVESVTLLKDAAAASIWGARAGNGVLVITTKKGRYNQPVSINLVSTTTIGKKPDLYANSGFMSSADFIDVEKELFNRNYYTNDATTLLSPVVELLFKYKSNPIANGNLAQKIEDLKTLDIRKQATEYLYQQSEQQQYALNINGGTSMFKYYLSGGYDRSHASIKRNNEERITLISTNTFRPIPKLEISASINYQLLKSQQNGMGITALPPQGKLRIYPYAQLADVDGNPLPLERQLKTSVIEANLVNKLDWNYRPLQEIALAGQSRKSSELRISLGANYMLMKPLNVELKYQYQLLPQEQVNLRDGQSYYARDLVNTYTLPDGTTLFPKGGILSSSRQETQTQYGRAQLNFNQTIASNHSITALAGMELRQVETTGSNHELYGYDPELLTYQSVLNYNTPYVTRPFGQQKRIPIPNQGLTGLTDRFISYYFNSGYNYLQKYSLSASTRWDASNLFGVRTNQRGVPLWSAGASWNISKEAFYKITWMPDLKLRATYGTNGNVNKSVTAFPTALYTSSSLTGLPSALLVRPGDPNLRWEKIHVINIGIDFSLKDQLFGGSIELYHKSGIDLFGDVLADPTTGFTIDRTALATKKINYANMQSKGLDINLNALLVKRDLKWRVDVLFSYITNKITKYNSDESNSVLSFLSVDIPPAKQGVSPDAFYSIPWRGINLETGGPLIYLNGLVSNDYTTYYNGLKATDLIHNGVSVPPYFGSLRNTFQYKNLELSFNLTWKAGYYFRRGSIFYNSLFSQWKGHPDFANRWQQPGDEKITQIPSLPASPNLMRDYVYNYSTELTDKGDNIRLQDIRLNWSVNKCLQVYGYARDQGIIWKKSKSREDPDQPNASYPNPPSYSIGISATF